MVAGRVSTKVLTDIGNAIRSKNGSSELYKPSEMAAAVASLDGTKAGEGIVSQPMELATGIVSSKVFDSIAAAIRVQNGTDDRYKPSEMAAAILALEWVGDPCLRAVLLEDGTLEFNYLPKACSVSGGAVVEAFEVGLDGYPSASARPWAGVKDGVKRVAIDASVSKAGVKNCSYWFESFSALREVTGFENLNGITDFTNTFANCSQLRSIYATSFDASTIERASSPFYGCTRLVGGTDCHACTSSDGKAAARIGEGGLLTDPADDNRIWVYGALDGNGELTIGATPLAGVDGAVASGDLCANARYAAIQCSPWASCAKQVKRIVFDASLSGVSEVNMSYWFYGCSALADVAGMSHLHGTRFMDYAFCGCAALLSLDMAGFDFVSLEGIDFAFSSCGSLTAINVSRDWELPAGCKGSLVFYNDVALVGGNGTAYDKDKIGASMCVVDRDGRPGYLTGI